MSARNPDSQDPSSPLEEGTEVLEESELNRLRRGPIPTEEKLQLPISGRMLDVAGDELATLLEAQFERMKQEVRQSAQLRLNEQENRLNRRLLLASIGLCSLLLLACLFLYRQVGSLNDQLSQADTQIKVLSAAMMNAEKTARSEFAREKSRAMSSFQQEISERQQKARFEFEAQLNQRLAVEKRKASLEIEQKMNEMIDRKAKQYGIKVLPSQGSIQ